MVASTSYCSTECQEQHWPHHKKACAARKKLWRAVPLIQALHIKFEAYTFEPVLENLSVKNGFLYCIDRQQTECVVTGKSKTQKLTRDQAPSEETFLAAIMANKCADVGSVCKPLLDTLLKPLGLRIEELCVIPRNIHRPTCTIAGKTRDVEEHIAFNTHNLLRITLPNGEQMAVDFSSPQMGWHETLAPWTVWKENRALFVAPPDSYGTLHGQVGWLTMLMGVGGDDGEKRRKMLIDLMEVTVRVEMARQIMATASQLFSPHETQYNSLANSLLASVEKRLAKESQHYAESRLGLQYYNNAWEICWTLNVAQTAALDDVWLTESEVQACGGDENQLRQIWARRCRGSRKQEQFKALGMHMQFK